MLLAAVAAVSFAHAAAAGVLVHIDKFSQRMMVAVDGQPAYLWPVSTGAGGYGTPVGWMASLVCDMLFLQRFYSDPSPWKNLRRIFKSVHRDYPVARRLKHMLITREDIQ